MSLVATCHCGGTRITVPGLPSDIKQCNCTYCHRTGAVWGYYKPEDLKIVAAEHDAVYAPGALNRHHFCAHCGGNTHGSSPDWAAAYNADGTAKEATSNDVPNAQIFAVNLRMVPDLDLSSLNIVKVDGRNNW